MKWIIGYSKEYDRLVKKVKDDYENKLEGLNEEN